MPGIRYFLGSSSSHILKVMLLSLLRVGASEGKSFPKFAKGRVQTFEVQLCCFTGSLFSLGSDKEKYLTDQ